MSTLSLDLLALLKLLKQPMPVLCHYGMQGENVY